MALLEVDSQGKATTIGIRTLAGGIVRSLTRAIIWAPALAFILVGIGIRVPDYVSSTLGLLGGAAACGALLLTGLILSAQACLPAWPSFPDSFVVWIASTTNVSAQTRPYCL